jgi:hypothetical protein
MFAPALALLPWLLEPPAPARQTANPVLPSGDEIARRVNSRDEGRMMSRSVTMDLVQRDGGSRRRVTRSFRKDYDRERRAVIFFLSPANIKGTAWLTYDYTDGQRRSDQWVYMPAARTVRRIPASERGASFLGSDFTHEDIRTETKLALDDYRRRTLGEEIVDERRCFVLEAVPVSSQVARELGYGKVLQWIDAEIWMPRRGAYWDTAGNPLKDLTIRDISRVQGIWTAHRFEAVNRRTGHRTILLVSDVEYPATLDDILFTERGMRRGL